MFDPKTRFKLFKQNKHFCAAPWGLIYVNTDGTVKTCVRGQTYGDLNKQNIEQIVSNEHYKSLRSEILQDKITKHCSECLASENNVTAGAFHSIRNHYNELSMNCSTDHNNVNQFGLTAVDLHWSSVCDLKCITCWHGQSSSIALEQNQSIRHTPTEVANKLIDYIVNNQNELKEVYLSGGEPTLIKYNLKLLQKLEKRSDLIIRVNSNLQWDLDNAILQEILKFPNVMFTCSADGIGEKFNYIRRGGNWGKFINNYEFLRLKSNVKLRVNTVFFVLTAQELPEILDYFFDKNVFDHTINQCGMGQNHLRSRNLPSNIKNNVRSSLENLLEKYQDSLNTSGCIKNCLRELDNSKTQEYKEYLDSIDRIQGSNWRSLYPELI